MSRLMYPLLAAGGGLYESPLMMGRPSRCWWIRESCTKENKRDAIRDEYAIGARLPRSKPRRTRLTVNGFPRGISLVICGAMCRLCEGYTLYCALRFLAVGERKGIERSDARSACTARRPISLTLPRVGPVQFPGAESKAIDQLRFMMEVFNRT
jgi:hypothetical protein